MDFGRSPPPSPAAARGARLLFLCIVTCACAASEGAVDGGVSDVGEGGRPDGSAAPSSMPGPSCRDLRADCGASRAEGCCASHLVPGGTFERDNGITGEVYATVSDFRLDAYEVTVGRFRNFVEGYAEHKPAPGSGKNLRNTLDRGWDPAWNDSLPASEDELVRDVQQCGEDFITFGSDDATLPMNCITWFEAYAFCIWDGGRLPTDAELNYAAAGGDQQRELPWAVPPESRELDDSYAVFLPEAAGPAPVGSKSPRGDGRWGHSDLSGNEWEWCQDWYRSYPERCINCANLTDYSIRVIRGGSFYSERESLYTTSRLYHAPNQSDFGVGVRCARLP